MDFPGLDVKALTDDELMKRISDIHGKMNYAHAYSSSVELMSQMIAILETLEFEQYARLNRKTWDAELKQSGVYVETDNDLKPKKETTGTDTGKRQQPRTPGGMFKRTKTPTDDHTGL